MEGEEWRRRRRRRKWINFFLEGYVQFLLFAKGTTERNPYGVNQIQFHDLLGSESMILKLVKIDISF